MLNSEMLLNILTPDTISLLGIDQVSTIKLLGRQSKYLTIEKTKNTYFAEQRLQYEAKRIKELSKSYITKGLDETSKILFCSEIKFANDEQIIKLLAEKGISIDAIESLNSLIVECQNADIKCTMAKARLENNHDLSLKQAEKIIRLKAALINNNYNLNEEDIKLYAEAQKMLKVLKLFEIQKSRSLRMLNDNEIIKKLLYINKDYFGMEDEDIFILINKINELIVTCPEKLMSNENQKKLN